MNHLTGLKIGVVSEWPSLKNFGKKENTMKYMTNQMLQRFMSNMATKLTLCQLSRFEVEDEIAFCKQDARFWKHLPFWYKEREILKKKYLALSSLQQEVKYNYLSHSRLQRMEKAVTGFISFQECECNWAYYDYLENRYDPFYRNKSKQAKQKLKKLVELQQAIRKQKSITRD